MKRVEQEKRRDIIKRSGRALPIASGATSKKSVSNSRYVSKNTSKSPGKRVPSPGNSSIPNISNVKSSGYAGRNSRQRTPSRERRVQNSSQGTRAARMDAAHASNRTGITGITAITGRTAQPHAQPRIGSRDLTARQTDDARTAMLNADGAFGA